MKTVKSKLKVKVIIKRPEVHILMGKFVYALKEEHLIHTRTPGILYSLECAV